MELDKFPCISHAATAMIIIYRKNKLNQNPCKKNILLIEIIGRVPCCLVSIYDYLFYILKLILSSISVVIIYLSALYPQSPFLPL